MEANHKVLIVMAIWGVVSNILGLNLRDKPAELIISTILVAIGANLLIR